MISEDELNGLSCLRCGNKGFDEIDIYYCCKACGNVIMSGDQMNILRGYNGQEDKRAAEGHKKTAEG